MPSAAEPTSKISPKGEIDSVLDIVLPDVMNQMAWMINGNAHDKGFYDEPRLFSTSIALIHSELSEALEADREGTMSTKIPGFSGVTEELADAVIRILDTACEENLLLGEAILAKHRYNLTRPRKHGKAY